MNLVEIFFAFHPPVPIRDLRTRREDWRCIFGHVQAYGYTIDENWLFFDPQGVGAHISVAHLHDEVLDRLASIRSTANLILSFRPDGRKFRVPIHPPMTCATQCGALIGRRAWTPSGLRRMLLRDGAEVIWERPVENPERGSERQGSPLAGTAHVGTGAVAHGPDASA